MQGERASMGSLSEALNFESGSSSSSSSSTNPVLDQQIRWENLQSLGDNDVQNYMNSSAADTNTNSVYPPEQRRFSLGEASSSSGTKHEAPTITEQWMAIRHLEQELRDDKVELNHPLFMQPSTANLNAAEHLQGLNPVTTGHPSLFGSGLIPENGGSLVDGQRKRKANDAGIGQSSSLGGFREFHRGESSSGVSASSSLFNGPRGLVPGNLSAPPESSRRNLSVRVNPTAQPETVIRQPVAPSLSAQQLMELRYRQAFENYTPPNASASLSRNMIPSFQLSASPSSSSAETTRQRSNVVANPLFVPPPGMINLAGPAPSSSRTSVQPSPVLTSNSAHHQRRLSEHLRRRSLLSSLATNHRAARSSAPPPASQHVLPSGGDQNRSYSRAAVPRQQGQPTNGVPQSLRGRGRLAELRNVLEEMRRTGALRLEDVMLLNQSMLGAAAADRYRDMRLDVDNMSYEELLSLGERIGDVCTGLNEQTISNRLKQRKYSSSDTQEIEPCCICQEEYNEGEEVGMLECGHGFHSQCIKEWLKRKNLCPICKTTGLNTAPDKPGL